MPSPAHAELPSRAPWPRGVITWAGIGLEVAVLLAMVSAAAGGALEHDAEAGPRSFPVHVGVRALPALAVVALHALARARELTVRVASRERSPFFVSAPIVMAVAAAAHPGSLPWPLALLAGLLTGALFVLVVAPVHELTTPLAESLEARPFRELHVAAALATLGSLGGGIRGGALVATPTVGLGVVLLLRGLREDARDLRRGRGSRAGAGVRLALGLVLAALGVGIGCVVTGMSLFERTYQ